MSEAERLLLDWARIAEALGLADDRALMRGLPETPVVSVVGLARATLAWRAGLGEAARMSVG